MKKLVFVMLIISSLFADYKVTQYIGAIGDVSYIQIKNEYIVNILTFENGYIIFRKNNKLIWLYGNLKIEEL